MPNPDGSLSSREICDGAVLERALADESVSSVKIQVTLESDNFVTGTSGWQINRDTGSVEFQDATIRGTLNASDITSGTLNVSFLAGGTITAEEIVFSNSSSSILRSANYVANSTGWQILGNGNAEFNDVEIRGTLSTNTITGNLTMDGTGRIRTASSGERVELTDAGIEFFDSTGTAQGVIVANTSGFLGLGKSGGGIINLGPRYQAEANGATDTIFAIRSVGTADLFQMIKTGTDTADLTLGAGNLIMDAGDLTLTNGDLELANGNATIDGSLLLQDAGVTEWTMLANTSDNFELRDDDGTARIQVNQTGSMFFRKDNGDVQITLSGTRVNLNGAGTTFVQLPVKSTTGDPSSPADGDMYVNTFDNTVRVFADTAWRDLATW